MQEKRGSTRERGLAALVTQLASVYSYDYLCDRRAGGISPCDELSASIQWVQSSLARAAVTGARPGHDQSLPGPSGAVYPCIPALRSMDCSHGHMPCR